MSNVMSISCTYFESLQTPTRPISFLVLTFIHGFLQCSSTAGKMAYCDFPVGQLYNERYVALSTVSFISRNVLTEKVDLLASTSCL